MVTIFGFSHLHSAWRAMEEKVCGLKKSLDSKSKMLFSFVNGVLTNAALKGDWILLDEVNMADSDVLDCLAEVINPRYDRTAGKPLLISVTFFPFYVAET